MLLKHQWCASNPAAVCGCRKWHSEAAQGGGARCLLLLLLASLCRPYAVVPYAFPYALVVPPFRKWHSEAALRKVVERVAAAEARRSIGPWQEPQMPDSIMKQVRICAMMAVFGNIWRPLQVRVLLPLKVCQSSTW
jgi:hypothetical protein